MSAIQKAPKRPLSTYLHKRPNTRLFALLALPMTWLVGVYIISLTLLLVTAFWFIDPFT
jgi:putative spermidine/putrescine transport system permease protein